MIVGAENLGRSLGSPYGQLLLAKLALFGLMLALAAANRWQLTPALAAAVPETNTDNVAADADLAIAAMRSRLVIEESDDHALLALFAWLGTLAPLGAVVPVCTPVPPHGRAEERGVEQ